MIEKLKNDELIFQKAGLIIGTLAGIVIGFIVSDRADNYVTVVEEENPDGQEES